MRIVKSRHSDDSSNVAQDIEHAKMRMIYENPADYTEWRLRMGLQKPFEPRGDPVMRARVAKLFSSLGASLEPPRSRRRRDFQLPVESLAEYGRQPLTVSDALVGHMHRPRAAE